MRHTLIYILSLVVLCSCGSSNSSSRNNQKVSTIDPPRLLSSDYELNGDINLDWNSSEDNNYDLYYSSENDFEIENYSVYDNSGFVQDIEPPYQFKTPAPAPEYTIKLVSKKDGIVSNPTSRLFKTRYRIEGDNNELFSDALSGLTWRRCGEGQTWNNLENKCDGEALEFNDARGRMAFSNLTDGWRVPSEADFSSFRPCGTSIENPLCMLDDDQENFKKLFLGSTKRGYLDNSIFKPFVSANNSFDPRINVHIFTNFIIVSVNDIKNVSIHAVLVKDTQIN